MFRTLGGGGGVLYVQIFSISRKLLKLEVSNVHSFLSEYISRDSRNDSQAQQTTERWCLIDGSVSLFPQGMISEVTAEHNREMLFKANEDFIVLVQAHVRGYLTRRAFRERMEFLSQQLPAITTIQVNTTVVLELVLWLWVSVIS